MSGEVRVSTSFKTSEEQVPHESTTSPMTSRHSCKELTSVQIQQTTHVLFTNGRLSMPVYIKAMTGWNIQCHGMLFFILHFAISLGFQLLLGTDKGNVFTSTMDTDVGKICERSTMTARKINAVLAWNEFRAVDVRSWLTVQLMPIDCCRYKKTEHTSKLYYQLHHF